MASIHNKLPQQQANNPITIFVVSDSTGETANNVAQAAVAQFADGVAVLQRFPQVRTSSQIKEIVREAAHRNALIAYTLVLPEYRETLAREAKTWNIQALDLLGPIIGKVAELTSQLPLSQPGRLRNLDEAYFRRIEAINFAVHCDDGSGSDRLTEADVILIGVSRASKTPTCLYLAQHYALKTANIPIVLTIPAPPALFQVNRKKIVGLTIEPFVLQSIRTTRSQVMGLSHSSNYSELDNIAEEIKYARTIFRELKCHVIDVSSRAIEETASEVSLYLSSINA